MKTKFLLLALVAIFALQLSAGNPNDLKHLKGTKLPMKEVPSKSIGGRPGIRPYSLDGMFDYDVVLAEDVLFIVVKADVETTRVRIDCVGETVYEAIESTLGGEVIEISLTAWQQGTYTLYLQNKDHILKGEFMF